MKKNVIFCPYRICPLGAHVDHQHGKVLGFSINKGIHFFYKKSKKIKLTSREFSGKIVFGLKDYITPMKDWGDYMRGSIKILREKYKLKYGVTGKFEGDFMPGGLSSSAAVTLSFIKAICSVNSISLTNEELIDTANRVETEFLGLKIGKLDQSCEVLGRANSCLFLDTKDMRYMNIPENPDIRGTYKLLVIYSGAPRNLIDSDYNTRVDECKSAAYLTLAFNNLKYGKYKDTYLRDVNESYFLEVSEKLPAKWRKRAMHFYEENKRVDEGVEAWNAGDLVKFGELINKSCESSIFLYEAGSELLVELNNIIKNLPGVYGTRFMGGGFNGSVLAVVNSQSLDVVIEGLYDDFVSAHPELRKDFKIEICEIVDGIGAK